jgi:hypothetical protein
MYYGMAGDSLVAKCLEEEYGNVDLCFMCAVNGLRNLS